MPSPDYRLLFRSSPAPSLLLLPDAPRFTIVEVNDAYLEATQSRRAELVGNGIFEAFPDNPENPESNGVQNLGNSLSFVLENGQSHVMGLQRYDIPDREEGTFQKSWWEPKNTPILDDNGTLCYILHVVQKVDDQEKLQSYHLRKLEELERSILEYYERDEHDLSTLLERYMTGIESLHPGMYTSIMELRDGLLHPWVAPSLSDSFIEMLHDLEPGPDRGSCGAAVWNRSHWSEPHSFYRSFWTIIVKRSRSVSPTSGIPTSTSRPMNRSTIGTF